MKLSIVVRGFYLNRWLSGHTVFHHVEETFLFPCIGCHSSNKRLFIWLSQLLPYQRLSPLLVFISKASHLISANVTLSGALSDIRGSLLCYSFDRANLLTKRFKGFSFGFLQPGISSVAFLVFSDFLFLFFHHFVRFRGHIGIFIQSSFINRI